MTSLSDIWDAAQERFALAPGHLRIFLHLYVTYAPYPEPERHAPFYREAVNMLQANGLIEPGVPPGDDVDYHGWQVTERGKFWLNMLLQTPLPVAQWVDPRTGRVVGDE